MFEVAGLRFTFFENQVHAIDDLDISFNAGAVHALIGENGAGKSTFARIAAGHIRPSSGSMRIDSRPFSPASPANALDSGVALVPQHPVLAAELNVWQNLVLGRSCLGIEGGRLSRRKTLAGLQAKLGEIGIELPLEQRADSLDTAQIHWVAVAESVLADPKILILDEPSAPYTQSDIEKLYGLLRRMASGGATVIVITHKLNEVLSFCDRIHVLRRGKLVGQRNASEAKADELQRLMFGENDAPAVGQVQTMDRSTPAGTKKSDPQVEGRAAGIVPAGLELESVSVDDGPGRKLRSFTLAAPRGAVTGVLGLKDQGLEVLEDLVAGMIRLYSGNMRFDSQAFAAGVSRGYIPSRRFQRGIAPGLSIRDNAVARSRATAFPAGFYSRPVSDKLSESRGMSADRPPDQGVTTLSGGMIQRLIIERELSLPEPEFILCAEPFWGLDKHFQSELSRKLHESAARGACVLVLLSDIDDALSLCDRIHVLERGKNAGSWPRTGFDRDQIAAAMIRNIPSQSRTITA